MKKTPLFILQAIEAGVEARGGLRRSLLFRLLARRYNVIQLTVVETIQKDFSGMPCCVEFRSVLPCLKQQLNCCLWGSIEGYRSVGFH